MFEFVHALLYLGFVSHGSLAQHGDLGTGLLLQTLDCVALRSQNLPHEIELTAGEQQKLARWSKVGVSNTLKQRHANTDARLLTGKVDVKLQCAFQST